MKMFAWYILDDLLGNKMTSQQLVLLRMAFSQPSSHLKICFSTIFQNISIDGILIVLVPEGSTIEETVRTNL